MNLFMQHLNCYLIPGPVTPIRLKGTDNSSGIVEINYNGDWGTIFVSSVSNGISYKDANVICNMLGYKVGYVCIKFHGKNKRDTRS